MIINKLKIILNKIKINNKLKLMFNNNYTNKMYKQIKLKF